MVNINDTPLLRTIRDLKLRNPSINIALEEAIARRVSSGAAPPTVRFWRNSNSAIIGRSQKVESELALPRCHQTGLPIVRRPTGGGTVLHHPENLNYSIYLPDSGSGTVEEESIKWNESICLALTGLGIDIQARSNGLFVGSDKIGGTAQSRRWGLLHHGTLLLKRSEIMSSMEDLLLAQKQSYRELNPNLPSKPASVTNLDDLIPERVKVHRVIDNLINQIAETLDLSPVSGTISPDEWRSALELVDRKYDSNTWTFRFSETLPGRKSMEALV